MVMELSSQKLDTPDKGNFKYVINPDFSHSILAFESSILGAC